MAPRGGTRSLLRRLLGAHGAALLVEVGDGTPSAADAPQDATAGFARCGAQRGEAVLACKAGVHAGRCNLTERAVATTKVLTLCGMCATALWFGSAAALAADPTPPPTTTTTDAPPPDPYKPPVPSVKTTPVAPHRVAPVHRSVPVAPARTFTPSVRTASRPATRTPRPKQRPRKQPAQRFAKAALASTWLAPLSRVIAAARTPLQVPNESDQPYLWLAGLAFAVLAVAGLSLHTLSMRYLEPRFEWR
jgi:hypothetical protein